MKERPILFSAEMVRAILAGNKTQTRRAIKMPKWAVQDLSVDLDDDNRPVGICIATGCLAEIHCPYGQLGDRLWVRETWCPIDDTEHGGEKWVDYRATPRYSVEHPAGWENAPQDAEALKWKSSRFMPRWASRITLEIVNVRVERVQNISERDCCLETGSPVEWTGKGIEPYRRDMKTAFAYLWDSINAKRGFGWEVNPLVWVIEFKQVTR